ncbi:endonuclease III [Candidatus Woesearchaeota archaeon]|nr:endonuclease III [Candidatus Woesearchaeota archaeon]
MNTETVEKVIEILEKEAKHWQVPIITLIAQTKKDPYRVLIGTVLSLRTKDQVTAKACEKLFAVADTPEKMVKLSEKEIEKLIYPTGFYITKAKNIILISQKLLDEYKGKVPDEIDTLLTFPNVGRKTANLVLTEGYNKPAMCVDVHVNRISYRLGYVKTKTPEKTEMILRKKLPLKYWGEYNYLLVAFGQHLCVPVSPWCSRCPVSQYCERRGVKKSR